MTSLINLKALRLELGTDPADGSLHCKFEVETPGVTVQHCMAACATIMHQVKESLTLAGGQDETVALLDRTTEALRLHFNSEKGMQ